MVKKINSDKSFNKKIFVNHSCYGEKLFIEEEKKILFEPENYCFSEPKKKYVHCRRKISTFVKKNYFFFAQDNTFSVTDKYICILK